MLNFDMKRKIQSLRDILVGKIPDPKAQVEQITIAMIYKFMDDMDLQGIDSDFGGQREFFQGDYEKYAWSNIMDSQNSGQQKAVLYAEGIDKMVQNPNLPQLFRDIFRGAYLPYRDVDTLNMFLKEINDFSYDNSEDLGNAFEMLLSIMGSQGDAGQFRTPRHIIDMIVEIVEPSKNDRILDPACGTAGFLISAFKYIQRQNLDENGKSTLNATERNRLVENFSGYDISPDMVRLSRVNMYLHKFLKPNIYEYDTLTSLDRWDEQYDVILANPPFMTPKGGIIPHNRYQVQAKRAEVLFVDYIAEHLSTNGKAGIIVPEGIVFQSANAYKQLREYISHSGNMLYAVISLPAGVFNPYSGVKTSILLFDKTIAKKTDKILFVKINNDGFDLGAQRREINDNDIPKAIEVIKKFKAAILAEREFELPEYENDYAGIATKSEIAQQDYILVGERYKTVVAHDSHYPMVEIGEVCDFEYGKPLKQEDRKNGQYPVYGSNGIVGYHDEYLVKAPFIIVGRKGSAGKVTFSFKNGFPIDTTFYIDKTKLQTNLKYLYYILMNLELEKTNIQAGVPGLNRNDAYTKTIPLPPLDIQEQIVTEIEDYQKIIDGARQVVENYKPTIKIDTAWDMVELGEICEVITKGTTPTTNGFTFKNKGINFVKIESISENGFIDKNKLAYISQECHASLRRSQLMDSDILFSIAGTKLGISAIIKKGNLPANTNQALAIIRLKNTDIARYVLYCLRSNNVQTVVEKDKIGVAQFNFSLQQVSKIKIPLPPLDVQQKIVEAIEIEQKAVEECKKLIEIFEGKIKDKISEVWGETFQKNNTDNVNYNPYYDKFAARNVDDDFIDAVMEHEKKV